MPIVATPLEDRPNGWYTTIQLTRDGGSARKFFRVNTHDPDGALQAAGVPFLGSSFGGSIPALTANSIRTEPIGGHDIDADGGGWTLVEVAYEIPPPSLNRPTSLNTAFLDINQSVTQVPINSDMVSGTAIAQTSRQVTTYALVVRCYRFDIPLAEWAVFRDKTNESSVVLPPYNLGFVGVGLTAGPGELLYGPLTKTLTALPDGTPIFEVQFHMLYAPDHKFRWRQHNSAGQPTGPIVESILYEASNTSPQNLWFL